MFTLAIFVNFTVLPSLAVICDWDISTLNNNISEEEVKNNIITIKNNSTKEEYKMQLNEIVEFLDEELEGEHNEN